MDLEIVKGQMHLLEAFEKKYLNDCLIGEDNGSFIIRVSKDNFPTLNARKNSIVRSRIMFLDTGKEKKEYLRFINKDQCLFKKYLRNNHRVVLKKMKDIGCPALKRRLLFDQDGKILDIKYDLRGNKITLELCKKIMGIITENQTGLDNLRKVKIVPYRSNPIYHEFNGDSYTSKVYRCMDDAIELIKRNLSPSKQ